MEPVKKAPASRLPDKMRLRVGGKVLALSNLDKVLYPAAGFTKAQVLHYYLQAAAVMLPHLAGRALTMKRYPEGVAADSFFEKRCPGHRPEWMPVASNGYCQADDPACLAWLANMAALEIHPQLAPDREPGRPTWLVFDLDPGPPAGILECGRVGLVLRDMLQGMGLASWIKTSGGAGLHCYAPLNTPVSYDQTKSFARRLARVLAQHWPDQVTSEMKKELRRGKVFIDWSQNDVVKTTVSVYSLRAKPQPTVSTPLAWNELQEAIDTSRPERLVFLADQVLERIEKYGDLFREVLTKKQTLPSFSAE